MERGLQQELNEIQDKLSELQAEVVMEAFDNNAEVGFFFLCWFTGELKVEHKREAAEQREELYNVYAKDVETGEEFPLFWIGKDDLGGKIKWREDDDLCGSLLDLLVQSGVIKKSGKVHFVPLSSYYEVRLTDEEYMYNKQSINKGFLDLF